MARLQPGLQFTGSLGNISAYKVRGSNEVFLRTRGGPGREQVKKGKNFERTRENNTEMGGRSRAAKWVRYAMDDITSLTDHHLGNALQPLMNAIQDTDNTAVRGQRNICFSTAPNILAGFQVNKRFPVEQLMPCPVRYGISASDLSANVFIPAALPGVNLFLPSYAALFGFVVCLGLLPDVAFTVQGYRPQDFSTPRIRVHTGWYASNEGSAAQELSLQLPALPEDGPHCLLLSFGIRLGKPGPAGSVIQHRYAGAGKILEVVRCP